MAEKTRMTPEWVAKVWADHPPRKTEDGNIVFFCRLAFVNLLERPKPGPDGREKAYGVVCLLPEGADPVLLKEEAKALFKEKAPQALTNRAIMARYHNPFKKQEDQVDKKTGVLYEGFVEGRLCISANSSKSQPPVVNQRGAPITDKSKVYSGCWALVSVRPDWFKAEGKEGPTFYLQTVMIVAEDESLGGVGAANPSRDFAGISISADVNPADAFGVSPAPDDESEDIFG